MKNEGIINGIEMMKKTYAGKALHERQKQFWGYSKLGNLANMKIDKGKGTVHLFLEPFNHLILLMSNNSQQSHLTAIRKMTVSPWIKGAM